MRRLGFVLALSAPMLMSGAAGAADVKFAYVGEISGSIAVSGGNFRDGVILAVEEINAKGGILKEKIALSLLDTQTNPGVARSQMQKTIDGDPYVILGPIFSGNVKVTMQLVKDAEIPQFIGGEAAELTTLGNPLHVPDLVRPADRHAEDRQLHPRRAQGENARADLGEQRLRQGRPRPADEGNGRAQHQDRRRRLHRIRPSRFRRRRRQAQGGERGRGVRLQQRGGMRAHHARSAQAGPQGAVRRRHDAAEPEDHRARRRCRQRRAWAMSASPPTRRSRQVADFAAQVPEAVQLQARPQRHQGLHRASMRSSTSPRRSSASSIARRSPRPCTA